MISKNYELFAKKLPVLSLNSILNGGFCFSQVF
jgi:hypothetical protein